MPQALDALWEPIELGSLTLRNRVMAGPATLLYAEALALKAPRR